MYNLSLRGRDVAFKYPTQPSWQVVHANKSHGAGVSTVGDTDISFVEIPKNHLKRTTGVQMVCFRKRAQNKNK